MSRSQKALGSGDKFYQVRLYLKTVFSPEPVEDDEVNDDVDDAGDDVDDAHDEGWEEVDPVVALHVLEGVHHQEVNHHVEAEPEDGPNPVGCGTKRR